MSLEVMKQALEALEKSEPVNQGVGYVKHHNNAKRALRAAIAEAEKEEEARLEQIMLDVWQDVGDPRLPGIKPRREWIGLTEEEITACKRTEKRYLSSQEFARAIEAKLKEKNT